jgi:hypothetical protein
MKTYKTASGRGKKGDGSEMEKENIYFLNKGNITVVLKDARAHC